MATIDQQFVEYIVKTLVNNPDDVKTDRTIDEKGVLINLEVNPEDVGRIIGRRGATAQSIRTLLRALGTKNDARYNLKIINNDDYQGPSSKDKEVQAETAEPVEPAEESATETVEETTTDIAPEEEDTETDSTLEKTRQELADLDDLDI